MSISAEDREACLNLEAELRGLVVCKETGFGRYLAPKDAVIGDHSECIPATPPDTAIGREWWAEALKLDVCQVGATKPLWSVSCYVPGSPWEENTLAIESSRPEAITQAIIAAARAHAEAKK